MKKKQVVTGIKLLFVMFLQLVLYAGFAGVVIFIIPSADYPLWCSIYSWLVLGCLLYCDFFKKVSPGLIIMLPITLLNYIIIYFYIIDN